MILTATNEILKRIVYIVNNVCMVFLLLHLRYSVSDVKFPVPTRLLMKEFWSKYFSDGAYHIFVRSTSQKLILHRILDIYPRIN